MLGGKTRVRVTFPAENRRRENRTGQRHVGDAEPDIVTTGVDTHPAALAGPPARDELGEHPRSLSVGIEPHDTGVGT